MSEIGIQDLIAQMRAMAARAAGGAEPAAGGEAAGGGFEALLRRAVDEVNARQQQAAGLAEAFERGEPGVELAQVMVALQRANVSFQAMTQVRNRLVEAYQEIFRMQI
ncbi:flagellar hook-basal body complex protein FliE [Inmirania thermothiophila]|uniref:Flagellar hook-basal body complex protein FliE n=1 Tax=Inmirania thermothiophila TaxID=1750597 RepID=A0A3N1Y8V4_9GAMM|nr:flagellar hook-basal body complex protein FliE [Inmirania thermothiophila]ROR34928.1 flagellar hook-basal body complex protein FliE [Inmirania thermothiophila]